MGEFLVIEFNFLDESEDKLLVEGFGVWDMGSFDEVEIAVGASG